ncbi:archaeal proteasome endopeptidase complex subunit alpha [Candidatus Woesearchaeota archaeon]|nr:archaeal proteasome endopeptidase complex subunit alpha [Candidatus Woesearchaeota archaeon]
MQAMPHQLMGYDRAITMFSPDGRLLQVEYAKKTVKQGSTAIGMVCKDGVLFVTDKKILDPLIITSEVEKIWQIDNHIGVTASGILSDARILIERAQVNAQQHKVTYDSPIDVSSVVKEICDLKQLTTQSGGLRPFGVSLLIGGIDESGAKLYLTDPTGIYFPYRAVVIGEGDSEITEILHKKYKTGMTVKEGIKLCLDSLKKVLDNNFKIDRVDVAYISEETKEFQRISQKELEKY